jgi:hypothetical protein
MIREALNIPDASFERTISALHFSNEKASLTARIGEKTKQNFAAIFELLKLDAS